MNRTLPILAVTAAAIVGVGASANAGSASPTLAAPQTVSVGGVLGLAGGWASHPVVSPRETFFKSTSYNVQTNGAAVTLSQFSNGTGQFFVDAVMKIVVKHADGTKSTFQHDFSGGCAVPSGPIGPVNLTSLFRPGRNTVTLTLNDNCGGEEAATSLYLTW
jgi:hypothetical protein